MTVDGEGLIVGSSAWLSLVSALLGGGAVSLVTYLAGRDKTRAETRKLEAETARIKAETASLITGEAGQLQGAHRSLDGS